MEAGSMQARLLGIETTNAGLVKVLRELTRCIGLLAAATLDGENQMVVLESAEEIETILARISEFLPPPD